MKARVYVTLKKGVLDPQGKAVQSGLEHLGFRGIKDVRVGKLIEIELEGLTLEEAQKSLKEMCESLLANTVIEDYHFEIGEGPEKVTDRCILSEGRVIA
ncbi:MAG: phosphoribosylformylglycinamidine synthase subunit PurS [Thermodesulfovibrionales bacterium]|nr:phosphoribosylformylglycinamidine synthase subunit PurS [Thermodesulfovibrionales bacterium]